MEVQNVLTGFSQPFIHPTNSEILEKHVKMNIKGRFSENSLIYLRKQRLEKGL